jgi:hypothetical protein
MEIATIVLLGIIIILLYVLIRRIELLDKKSIKYIRVFRQKVDFEATKSRFKELGYEISDVREMPDGFLAILFVKVK